MVLGVGIALLYDKQVPSCNFAGFLFFLGSNLPME